MAYCTNCGHQLADGAKFCFECGTKVDVSAAQASEQRKTIYDGEIHKCPQCGDVIDPYEIICESCGFEIRGRKTTSVVHKLSLKLEQTANPQKKAELIRNFYIPNTKEDIIECLILASSNIETSSECREAWAAKLAQTYQKARLTFGSNDDFIYIEELYFKTRDSLQKGRIALNAKRTFSFIGKIFLCVIGAIIALAGAFFFMPVLLILGVFIFALGLMGYKALSNMIKGIFGKTASK